MAPSMLVPMNDMSTPDAPPIRAQVSIYPLRQTHLTPAIDALRTTLEKHGLVVVVGAMSTQVSGNLGCLFEALREGFECAAATGDLVMTITVSNCCSAPR